MGNIQATPPDLSPKEAAEARVRYCERISRMLNVPTTAVTNPPLKGEASSNTGAGKGEDLSENDATANVVVVTVDEASAKALSDRAGFLVEPHTALVSFGHSWEAGCELVMRFAPEEVSEELINDVRQQMALWRTMQERASFGPHESAQMTSNFFAHRERGELGALIAPDNLLEGTHGCGDELREVVPGDAMHDADYIPRMFLTMHPLTPTEYAELHGLPVSAFVGLVRKHWSHTLLHKSTRRLHLQDEDMQRAMEELRRTVPVKHLSEGATFDIRVRKNASEVDLLLAPRCLAHLLIPLAKGFDKEVVPVGTIIGIQSEGYQAKATFSCHDASGTEVTPDTAAYGVQLLRYGDGGDGLLDEDPATDLENLLLSPSELWEEHGRIRMLEMHFMLPRAMLARMLHDVRARLDGAANPCGVVWEWPEMITQDARRGAVLAPLRERGERRSRVRLISAPMQYFQDETSITDDGEFDPPLSEVDGL